MRPFADRGRNENFKKLFSVRRLFSCGRHRFDRYSAELYSGGGGGGGGGGDEYSDSSGGCGRRALFEVRGGLTRRPILTAAVLQKVAAAARSYGRGE